MSHELYSKILVSLAKDPRYTKLPEAWSHRAKVASPLCGDELELFLRIDEGRCVEIGYEAHACILCKASSHVMCAQLEGKELSSQNAARQSLEEAIADAKTTGPYAGFEVLSRFPSRHACALLPWRALERALVETWGEEPPQSSEPAQEVSTDALKARHALEVVQQWRAQGQDTVLVTLVAVDGSSPCPLGSHMVVSQTGAFWGSVSGGCVESAVVTAAIELMSESSPKAHRRLTYTIANSQAGEVGLPCGGQIQVYLQKSPPLEHIERWSAITREAPLHLRVVALDGGEPVLCSLEDWDASLPLKLKEQIPHDADTPFLWKSDRGKDYFVEPVCLPPQIFIVGGTHVAQKLSWLCQGLGFEPVVIEPRAALGKKERFPGATVLQESPETVLAQQLHADAAVIMLTHNPRLDDPAIKLALESRAYYVGALGSRKTQRERLARLEQEGVPMQQLERIHGPVGLSIGAKGASEIALSILAEVVQSRRNASLVTKKIGAVVLAAGASQRFGRENKLLASTEHSVVLRQVVSRVLEAGIKPCVVVLGHEAPVVRESLSGLAVEFVENADYAQGMGGSVACGMQAIAQTKVDAAFVVLGDMPAVRVEDYEALAAAHRASTQHLIVAPEAGRANARRLGNPILWPRRYFKELTQLSGDRGAKALLLDAPGAVLRLYIAHPGVLRDVDTKADLAAVTSTTQEAHNAQETEA